MHLPPEIWEVIYAHRAAMVLQRVARQRIGARLHYGHIHQPDWCKLRQRLAVNGVLRRIYPYPLARREWRTEMESWCFHDVDVDALAEDMELTSYWGQPAPVLSTLSSSKTKTCDS